MLLVDEYAPGYGKVAAFEDCDPGFQICRKFLWLHTRVLLHIQDELQELEGTLESLDRWEATQGDRRKLTHRRIDDECEQSPRKELLLQIKGKLEEYDEILFRMQKKQAMKRPTKRNQNSVYNLINTSKSMGSSEALWIRQWDDLAALSHDTDRRLVESHIAHDHLGGYILSVAKPCHRSWSSYSTISSRPKPHSQVAISVIRLAQFPVFNFECSLISNQHII